MKFSTVQTSLSNSHSVANGYKPYLKYFLFICLFYVAIAGVLAIFVQWGILDEDFHLEASKPFAQFGINLTTLNNHIPPTGVSSHFWFAFWLWLFPSINYIGLRLITCVALGLLGVFSYLQLKALPVDFQRRVLAASLFMLAFPYFFVSVSAVMTEGPALIFLFAGLLVLTFSRLQKLFPFFLACLLLGCTTVARFYFIPLLPALFITLFISDWQEYTQTSFRHGGTNKLFRYLFIGVGLLPLVGLAVVWGGLTPPAFHQWSKLRTGISFNAFRPISTVALLGIYSAPVVLGNVAWSGNVIRKVIVSLPIALVLAIFRINVFHDPASINDVFSGPVEHTLAWLEAKGAFVLVMGLFVVYYLSLFSLTFVINWLIGFIRAKNFSDKALIYSIFFVVLFVAAQAFVGGNHPFYDRYLIHPWPFMGYILICMFPNFFNLRTFLVLSSYTGLSVLQLIK